MCFKVQKNSTLIFINYYPFKHDKISVESVLSVINSTTICFESIDVYPKNKIKNGYGTTLLKYIIDYCTKLGYSNIVLNVLDDKEYLIKWYKTRGFTIANISLENRVFLMRLII